MHVIPGTKRSEAGCLRKRANMKRGIFLEEDKQAVWTMACNGQLSMNVAAQQMEQGGGKQGDLLQSVSRETLEERCKRIFLRGARMTPSPSAFAADSGKCKVKQPAAALNSHSI